MAAHPPKPWEMMATGSFRTEGCAAGRKIVPRMVSPSRLQAKGLHSTGLVLFMDGVSAREFRTFGVGNPGSLLSCLGYVIAGSDRGSLTGVSLCSDAEPRGNPEDSKGFRFSDDIIASPHGKSRMCSGFSGRPFSLHRTGNTWILRIWIGSSGSQSPPPREGSACIAPGFRVNLT